MTRMTQIARTFRQGGGFKETRKEEKNGHK